jgi:hypothetical protein
MFKKGRLLRRVGEERIIPEFIKEVKKLAAEEKASRKDKTRVY